MRAGEMGGRGEETVDAAASAAVVVVTFGSNGWPHATAMHTHTRVEVNSTNTAAASRPQRACKMRGSGGRGVVVEGNQNERLEDARRSGAKKKKGNALQGVWQQRGDAS